MKAEYDVRWPKETAGFLTVLVLTALAVALARHGTTVSFLWPVNGLVLGVCLLSNRWRAYRLLMACAMGHTLAGLWAQDTLGTAMGFAAANTLELLIAWVPLRAQVLHVHNLGHPSILWRFSLFAIALGPAAGAACAALVFFLNGLPHPEVAFKTWWAGDALGMAVFGPLAVTFRREAWPVLLQTEVRKTAMVRLSVLLITTLVIFLNPKTPFLFLLFPPMIWLVFRMGFAGASLGALVVCAIGFPVTLAGYGPLSVVGGMGLDVRLLVLQLFVGTSLLVTLPIGMVLDHRDRLMQALRSREQELMHLAHHDPLTGLLNRRGFDERLRTLDLLPEGTAEAVVVMDVDHFKSYNDRYGHPEGDACLTWLGQLLHDVSEDGRFPVSRQGGEEFGAFLRVANAQQALAWAERFRSLVFEAQRPHEGSPFGVVTVSIGVACRTTVGRMGDGDVLSEADASLYRAKAEGRNRVVLGAVGSERS